MHSSKRTRLGFILCTLLALLAPSAAIAQPDKGSVLSIAASTLRFGYQEFNDAGQMLDREDGNIPGVVVGMSSNSGSWLFAGDASYYGGNVDYDGQTNTAPPVPVRTRTTQNIADVALRTEYWLQNGKASRYALYLGGGYHYWGRDIQPASDANGNPVGGLFEAYTWWSGFLGAKAALYDSGTSRWLLDARLMQIINPTMDVRFSGYDSSRLALGERPGIRISLPWRYTMNRSSSFGIEPYAESYELGRSANTPLTINGSATGQQIYEPQSKTRNYGLSVGINQHF